MACAVVACFLDVSGSASERTANFLPLKGLPFMRRANSFSFPADLGPFAPGARPPQQWQPLHANGYRAAQAHHLLLGLDGQLAIKPDPGSGGVQQPQPQLGLGQMLPQTAAIGQVTHQSSLK